MLQEQDTLRQEIHRLRSDLIAAGLNPDRSPLQTGCAYLSSVKVGVHCWCSVSPVCK